jgi:parallel beta-helix repeat protein
MPAKSGDLAGTETFQFLKNLLYPKNIKVFIDNLSICVILFLVHINSFVKGGIPMKKLIFAVLWLLIIVPSAFPAIINVPAEVSTIQGAINSAMDGDTVLVAEGIYYENISFLGKGILVASNFIFDKDTATINATIIDGSNPANPDSGSVVRFVSGEDSSAVITGFTLRNGSGTIGDIGPSGGGLYVHNSSSVITFNKIERNRTDEGGGIFCSGGSCKIMNNTIIGNFSRDAGGGIFSLNSPSIFISGNIIKDDTVETSGAGILCDNSTVIIRDNIITGSISLMIGPSYGGGISCAFSSGLIESNYLAQNTATEGGGIFSDCCRMSIIGNVIYQNSYQGICSWMDTSTTIANNIVTDNERVGIHCLEGQDIIVTNNTINGGGHAGVLLGGEASMSKISNNIISNVSGWGIRCEGASGWEISYNDLWNNSLDVFSLCQGDLGDTSWGENWNGIPCDSFYNIFRDPLFVDSQAGDFHLLSNSPCIDAGSNAVSNLPPTDFEGKPRVVDGNGDDSAVVDMGALEYHLNRGDVNQDGVINTADVVYLINYLFIHGPVPDPLYVGDCNCDEVINSADVIYLINYLFVGGPPPCG